MKRLFGVHPLILALVVTASVASFLAFPAEASAYDERVWQGFNVLPRSLPEDAPDDNRQVYMVINNKGNDGDGNGAYIPDTTVKIYSQGSPSAAGRQITIYPRSGCHRNVTMSYATWILDSKNRTDESRFRGDTGYNTESTKACDPITWTLPVSAFAESNIDRHRGLWVAVVTFETDAPTGQESGFYGVKFRVQAHGASRLGYQGGSYVNFSTANVGPRNNSLRNYDITFAETCNKPSRKMKFQWGDDDYGTKTASEPDVPGAGPEDTLLRVDFAAWSKKNKTFWGNQGSPGFIKYSYDNETVGAGELEFPAMSDGNYSIRFSEVDPNNGITFEYPRDSADFYLPCPGPTPQKTAQLMGDCTLNGKAINGIAYDEDNPAKNIEVEVYMNGRRGQGGTLVGKTTTQGPGYYLINVDAAMGSPPKGMFTFYVYALGIDSAGNPDGFDGEPVVLSKSCGDPFETPGCPSMTNGMQDITVPMRDGIPESDNMPPNVTEDGKDLEVKLRNPTGANGTQWEHMMLRVYDQWGQDDGAYLPWGWTTNPTFKVDYTPFMRAYPYDYHAISVMYATKYNEITYKYDAPVGRYCDNGGQLSGTNCVQSYQANSVPNNRCPFGGTYQPGPNRCYTSITPAKTMYGPRLVNIDFKQMWWSYGLTPPSAIGGDNNYWTQASTPILEPCYRRTYEADRNSVSISQPQISPNVENPSAVNYSWQFGVRYGLVPAGPTPPWVAYDRPQSPQVRAQFKADLHYRATYYLKRGGGLSQIGSKTGTGDMPSSWFTGGPLMRAESDSHGISVPPYRVGDQICMGLEVWYPNGEMNNDGNDPVFGNRPIVYPQIDNTDGAPVQLDPNQYCSARVTNEPYAHFFGGDVTAGLGFSEGESCVVDPNGQIRMLTRTTGALPKGSGSQYAAQALGEIQGMSSANLRKLIPTGSTGLSFSNTESGGSTLDAPGLGGKFGLGGSACIPDYFATKPKDTPVNTTATTAPIGTAGVQHYRPAGGKVSIGGGTVGVGTRQAIYIENADLYISGNINFAQAETGWSSLKDIPSLYIIVKNGNVRIDPSVTQLDGVYIAQPTSSNDKGVISTCGTQDRSFQAYELLSWCKNQLTVNGAFVAKQIFLNRSFSSLRYAERYAGASGESPLYGDVHSCGEAGADVPHSGPFSSNDCAAEIFNFGPEFYMAQPAITPNGGPASGRFHSVTGLSPVL